MEGLLQDEYLFFIEFAATTIQRHYRGYRERKKYWTQKHEDLQRQQLRYEAEYVAHERDDAARRIQRAWMGFRNRRIFLFYRDLIQFRERGDPRLMLRAINPREAALADAAAGIHVRFRLGGAMFPPLVFYKIFTHRSVTDINAFGPRNYAAEASVPAKAVHNKPKRAVEPDFDMAEELREFIRPDGTRGFRSTRGWYARSDNNGWRPIAERVLVDGEADTGAAKSQPHFHYNPAVRREERIRRAKQRRREWMLKLYRIHTEGLSAAQQAGADVQGADLPDLDQLLGPGGEGLDELAEDELLAWSSNLDYASYTDEWTSLACTLGSEAYSIPVQETSLLASLPPPSQDVRAAMVAAGVPLAPFKGGVSPAAGATSGLHLVR
uniref:Uncharacterized protein n=1 Tax=Chlamydomonas leiostraca TaxID=1034604 RepID=A0A7S0RDM8_9CHLO|mmetsp:Transcript_20279/g.51338  ORF Transcript_20279/g.51338 Transcript_20279/m.51338 type:complete len:381 (+) Transcript_20279:35-1177(+)